jgi:hypothetical protein
VPTTLNYTDIYKLFVLGPNTETSRFPAGDQQRFEAIEVQLFELYSMFGNGVTSGWEISTDVVDGSTGPRIYVTAGSGHVYYKYAATTDNTAVDLIIPEGVSVSTTPVTYYMYGVETDTTHYDKSVSFLPFTTPQSDPTYIYLGRCTLSVNDDGDYVLTVDYTNRDTINIFSVLSEMIRTHVHLGGTNPPKINLRRHVAGVPPGDFIEASLDAAQVTRGKLGLDRLPQISHELLSNRGTLTHPQIDTLLGLLNTGTYERLDDVQRTVLLETIIAIKKVFFDIDETLINTFIYFPGVTDSSYVDQVRTTAVIDAEEQQIVGIQAAPATSDFVNWEGESELETEYAETVTPANTGLVVVDGELQIEVPLNFRAVHAISGSGAMDWEAYVEATPEDVGPGGTVSVNVGVQLWQFQRFKSGSTYTPQSWTRVNKLQFGFKLVNPDILEHGEVYFFLIGADHEMLASKQVSYTSTGSSTTYSLTFSGGVKILDSEDQTTEEADQILPVTIDLLQWPDRRTIIGYGFYVSTATGWRPDKPFDFELHQVSYTDMTDDVAEYLMSVDPYSVGEEGNVTAYCWNDLYHSNEGRIIFRFDQPVTASWDYVYWDVEIPDVDPDVDPARIIVYTRTADQEAALPFQPEAIVSESDHVVHSAESNYIDVIVRFHADSANESSPILSSLTLYYTVSSSANAKSYATVDDFEDGLTKVNVSILDDPDRIELTDTSLVNASLFLEGDSLMVLDEDLLLVDDLSIDGSHLYLTPRQAFAKVGAGFRGPRSLQVLPNGHLVIADTKNDRIVEVDQDGYLYRAVQGNVYLPQAERDFVALTAYYNSRLGKIFVCFSQNINPDISREKFTLTTVDRTNSLQFLTDTDGIFSTFDNPDGKSAVLVITLGATRKLQVDSWDSDKVLIIAQGGLSGLAGSTSGTTAGVLAGEMGGTGGTTTTGGSTTGGSTGSSSSRSANILEGVDGGVFSTYEAIPGQDSESSEAPDETSTFDFDSDGSTDSETLMDVGSETSLVTVNVTDGDIVFANLQYPVYAEVAGDNNYVIAQAYSLSVLNIGMDEVVVWSFASSIVSFDSQLPGVASLLDDGTVLCASPTMKKVLQVVPSTKAIIFSHSPMYTPVFAVRLTTGNTVVVESDMTEGGLNSRVYEIDVDQDVVSEWGIGRLTRPTGVQVLDNGNWLVSC